MKHCNFRKKLLDYCRGVYEEIFVQDDFETLKQKAEDAGKKYTDADFKEQLLKRTHKLFGNIEFIGELFLCHLLRSDTAVSIFQHLLDRGCFTDDTVEAAIKFIEKVGPAVEEKIASAAAEGKKTKMISQEDYDLILKDFKEIWDVSQKAEEGVRVVKMRIQKLIQNMLENQALQWVKLKTADKDVKRKDQVEAEIIKKSQQAEQTRNQGYGDRNDGYGGGRGGGRGGRNDGRDNRDNRRDDRRDGEKVYMKKQGSMASNQSERTDQSGKSNRNRRGGNRQGGNDSAYNQNKGNDRGGDRDNKPREPRVEAFTLSEDELKTRMQVLFNKFIKSQTPSEEEK